MNRGSSARRRGGQHEHSASMRPRFMNRGSTLVRGLLIADKLDASMRPRFMNRGSAWIGRRAWNRATGFNEAPIHESGKCGDAAQYRRWNRGFNEAPIHESGKSPHDDPPPKRVAGFNEAPIHESGKLCPRAHGSALSTSFNEAPIHESGKCPRLRLASPSDLDASMRPRFMNRGSTGCRW